MIFETLELRGGLGFGPFLCADAMPWEPATASPQVMALMVTALAIFFMVESPNLEVYLAGFSACRKTMASR